MLTAPGLSGSKATHREAGEAGCGQQALRHLLGAAAPHVGNHAAMWNGCIDKALLCVGILRRCAVVQPLTVRRMAGAADPVRTCTHQPLPLRVCAVAKKSAYSSAVTNARTCSTCRR